MCTSVTQKSFFFPTFFFWLLLCSLFWKEKENLFFFLFSPCWLPFNYLVISSCLSKLEKRRRRISKANAFFFFFVIISLGSCWFAGLLFGFAPSLLRLFSFSRTSRRIEGYTWPWFRKSFSMASFFVVVFFLLRSPPQYVRELQLLSFSCGPLARAAQERDKKKSY